MKIIFSDLDGTLLRRGESVLNKNIKKSIYSILESGNMFCVSSGRTYIELRSFFKDFADDLIFVCNDGALTVYKEQTLCSKAIDKSLFVGFREFTAHGKYVTYVCSPRSFTIRNVMKQYHNHVMMTDSILDIREDIYKISDFDRSIDCPLPIVYRNHIMNEYIAQDCDKSDAVGFVSRLFKTDIKDTYAFGDNVNDLGMFKACGTSFAVSSAPPDIKKCADKITNNIEEEFSKIIGG